MKKNTSKLPENRWRLFSRSITKTRKRATRGGPQGAQAATWCGPTPGRARRAPGPPGATPGSPAGLYTPRDPKTLKKREFPDSRRRSVAETYREEKPSLAGRFRRGDHLPEGEIVAIVITIITGIIEIIINIIPIISTIYISIQSHLTIATRVVIR